VKLIQAKDVKQSVKQELDWFALERLNPRVILQPSTVSINNFRSLIHNHPMDNEIQGLNMVPGELARLCCKRYLSGDHVHWIIDKLNMQQNKVLCIYLNRVIDIERFANKKKREQTVLAFVINIGRNIDGSTYLGSDEKPGCHWVNCTYDSQTNIASHNDSLGWKSPTRLIVLIESFKKVFFPAISDPCELKSSHNSDRTDNFGSHYCHNTCSIYPLQTCNNICGVVALITAAIASLEEELYINLVEKQRDKGKILFLSTPSKYNKYLRCVIISWMSEDHIDVSYVIPAPTDGDEPEMISDDEDEILCTEEILQKIKEKKSNPAPVLKGNEKGPVRFPCEYCKEVTTFTRRNDLKRHIERFHGDRGMPPVVNSGKSICMDCGQRFFRITDLRKHLIKLHGKIFRMEIATFDNLQGTNTHT